MRKRCAVEGCSTGNPVERKKRKLLGEKVVSSFKVPNCPYRAEQWSKAIGATAPLTNRDFVCQLHFRNEDVITHFEQRMPDGTLFRMERERHMLREDVTPIATMIVSKEGDPIAETPRQSISYNTRVSETASNKVDDACTNDGSNSGRDADVGSADVDNDESDNDGDNESDDEDCGSKNAADTRPTYSTQSLKNDLKKSQWRPDWVWSSNTEGIIFVQLTRWTMQPKVRCSVYNDLGVTISLADKSYDLRLNEKVQDFQDVTDLLNGLESLETCAGTDHKKQKRSRACTGFLQDDQLYAKNRGFQRCVACRQLRHRLQKKSTEPKIAEKTKNSVVNKKLQVLKKRLKTLQNKVS